jgi:GNAT superfamily N-acetyltransferase
MIRCLRPEQTWPLRQQVLHSSRPWPTSLDPLDLTPHALHLGWLAEGVLIGIGSIGRDTPAVGDPTTAHWRLRGMAVLDSHQGRGIGGKLLLVLLAHAASLDPAGTAWCLGRLPAEGFYLRYGFRQMGRFEVPGKGPRLMLERSLSGDPLAPTGVEYDVSAG